MRVAAHSWLLETRYPLPQAMRRAREIGYDAYELDIGNFGGSGLGLQILPDRLQPAQRDELAQSEHDANIPICSLCLGALWHYPISGGDAAHSKRGVEIILASVPLARHLGADCILLPLDQPPGVSDADAWEATLRNLEPCVRLAEEQGVTLAIENVCSPFLLGASELARMVDQIASPACRVYYDVGNNTWIGRDPAQEIMELGARIVRFHFKNRSSPRGTPGTDTVSVGAPGIVPFDQVMRAIKAIEFDGYLVVEVPTLNKDADLIARDSLEALRNLIAPPQVAP
ncbi:MAG: sugar phosphate isomerase/epimerase family protein [Candidatus Limnocylindrales bacterium]